MFPFKRDDDSDENNTRFVGYDMTITNSDNECFKNINIFLVLYVIVIWDFCLFYVSCTFMCVCMDDNMCTMCAPFHSSSGLVLIPIYMPRLPCTIYVHDQ